MPTMPCAQPSSRPKPAGAAQRAAPGRRRAQGYTPPAAARHSTRKNDAFTSVKSPDYAIFMQYQSALAEYIRRQKEAERAALLQEEHWRQLDGCAFEAGLSELLRQR